MRAFLGLAGRFLSGNKGRNRIELVINLEGFFVKAVHVFAKDSIQPQVPLRLRLPLISKLFSTAYFDSDLRFLHSVSGSWLNQ